MRKCVSVCYFLLVVLTVDAQLVHFPVSNAIWSMDYSKDIVAGDSVFNGKLYRKFNRTYDSSGVGGVFFRLFREDTVSQKVYMVDPTTGAEKKMYDFSLAIGDTARIFNTYLFGQPVLTKVLAIDSVSVTGKWRRRWLIGRADNLFGAEHWIEGIGSTCGLFNSGAALAQVTDVLPPSLLCLQVNGVKIFYTAPFCYRPTGINSYKAENDFEVFPNPCSDRVLIKAQASVVRCSLISADGNLRLLAAQTESALDFNVSSLPPSIYFLTIETAEGIMNKKIVVER